MEWRLCALSSPGKKARYPCTAVKGVRTAEDGGLRHEQEHRDPANRTDAVCRPSSYVAKGSPDDTEPDPETFSMKTSTKGKVHNMRDTKRELARLSQNLARIYIKDSRSRDLIIHIMR